MSITNKTGKALTTIQSIETGTKRLTNAEVIDTVYTITYILTGRQFNADEIADLIEAYRLLGHVAAATEMPQCKN